MAFSYYTKPKLCLDRFAEIIGIHPLAFNNLSITNCVEDWVTPCENWSQVSWQSVWNIEQLAAFIKSAEIQIESYLGMFVAPTYTFEEIIEVPYFYRREEGKLRLEDLKFQTKWKNIINFGKSKSTYLGEGSVTYTDEDLDGFKETATIKLITAIEVTDLCAIELNVCGTENCNSFCPIRSSSFDSLTSELTVVVDSWLLKKPNLNKIGFKPNAKYIDGCDINNFLNCVGIYYTTKDSCATDVEVVWNKKDDCKSGICEEIVIPACAFVIDKCNGIFKIQPTQFNSTTHCPELLEDKCKLPHFPPDFIRINYNSGCLNIENSTDCSICKVCDKLERAIAMLAASMLPALWCNCGCSGDLLRYYQTDVSIKVQGLPSYSLPFEVLNNPFGTKLGAIEAFKIVDSILEEICN